MTNRFDGLKKIPKDPAMRLMALANIKFQSELKTPANASVPAVMEALETHEDRLTATMDMLRLMAAALPGRERTWWACLAARDVLGADKEVPETLKAAEAYVRKPNDDTRAAVRTALDMADPDDDTTLAAVSAVFADGTLGPGELKEYPAPPGAAVGTAFGMNVMALADAGNGFEKASQHLVDRALDLARGGNGKAQPVVSFQTEPPLRVKPDTQSDETEEATP